MAAPPVAKRARVSAHDAMVASMWRICATANVALDNERNEEGAAETAAVVEQKITNTLHYLVGYFNNWVNEPDNINSLRDNMEETCYNVQLWLDVAEELVSASPGIDIKIRTAAAFAPMFTACRQLTLGLSSKAQRQDVSDALRALAAISNPFDAHAVMLEFVPIHVGVYAVIDTCAAEVLRINKWDGWLPLSIASAGPAPAAPASAEPPAPAAPEPVPAAPASAVPVPTALSSSADEDFEGGDDGLVKFVTDCLVYSADGKLKIKTDLYPAYLRWGRAHHYSLSERQADAANYLLKQTDFIYHLMKQTKRLLPDGVKDILTITKTGTIWHLKLTCFSSAIDGQLPGVLASDTDGDDE